MVLLLNPSFILPCRVDGNQSAVHIVTKQTFEKKLLGCLFLTDAEIHCCLIPDLVDMTIMGIQLVSNSGCLKFSSVMAY